MTSLTVSEERPTDVGDGEWIDIRGHVGGIMSTLMADGGPLSVTVTDDGRTIVTPLRVGRDGVPADTEGRITSRSALIDEFRRRLMDNIDAAHTGKNGKQ